MKKGFLIVWMLGMGAWGVAQNADFEKFRQEQRAGFEKYRTDQQEKYDAFRERVNREYAEFMRKAWAEFPVREAEVPEEEERIAPVEYRSTDTVTSVQAEESRQPQFATNWSMSFRSSAQPEKKQVQQSRQIAADPAVAVVPKPTPTPEPIAPVNVRETADCQHVPVSYYGSTISIGFPRKDNLKIGDLSEDNLADAWQLLSGKQYDITVKTALDARQANRLCDWAYMEVLKAASEQQYGKSNEAVLMQAFLMTQSGYRVRLAKVADRLFMLVASKYQIYNMRYLSVEGTKFYVTGDYKGERLQMCPSKFDKEQSLSMQLAALPKFGEQPTPKRKLTSKKGVTASVSVNKNLIEFFRQYPQANIDGDFTTRWAAYANTPLDKSIRDELYPPLERTVLAMNERDAVGILLNWVQTAFKYGYDDEVWGGDRAFFAQETLYYPESDCEDRAILFSRLVRDLLGLDVALVYYPGHLAAAVAFKGQVEGDWIDCNGRKYVICDPTYINAPVGMTMPGMENKTAKIIVLK